MDREDLAEINTVWLYKRIIKVSVFQEMESSTVGKAWEQKVSTTDIPVRGKFFAEFIFL